MESRGGSLVREEKKDMEKTPWCTAFPRCCESRRISSESNKLGRKPGPCSKISESDPGKSLLSRMRGKGNLRVTRHEKLSIFPNRDAEQCKMWSSITHKDIWECSAVAAHPELWQISICLSLWRGAIASCVFLSKRNEFCRKNTEIYSSWKATRALGWFQDEQELQHKHKAN